MRRGLLAATLIAAVFAAGVPVAEAQARIQAQPRMQVQPRVNKAPKLPTLIIPPSQAVGIARGMMPGAKPVGIKRNGNNYIVTLRKNNQLNRVIINGQTGAPN